jgi:hypothetical protein
MLLSQLLILNASDQNVLTPYDERKTNEMRFQSKPYV